MDNPLLTNEQHRNAVEAHFDQSEQQTVPILDKISRYLQKQYSLEEAVSADIVQMIAQKMVNDITQNQQRDR